MENEKHSLEEILLSLPLNNTRLMAEPVKAHCSRVQPQPKARDVFAVYTYIMQMASNLLLQVLVAT